MAPRSSAMRSADLHATTSARLRSLGHTYPTRRRELVDILEAAEKPLSIPDILDHNRRLAQSSVYRNLAILELAGIVHRIVTKDEFARFELSEAVSGRHHHHLICSSCGAVEDVTLPATLERSVTRELGKLASDRGFAVSGHQMDLLGMCSICQ